MSEEKAPEETTPEETTPDGDEILTLSQAAARLGFTKTWLLRLIQAGRLPAVRHTSPRSPIGDYWELRAADLDLVRGLKSSGRPPKKKLPPP